jgi:hypothetical protein
MGWTEKEPAGANRPATSIGRSCGSTSRAASASIRNKQLIAQEIEVTTSSHRSLGRQIALRKPQILWYKLTPLFANSCRQIVSGAIWVRTFGMSGLGEIAKADAVP